MHLSLELTQAFLQQAAVPAAEALVSGLWQGIALAVLTGLVLRLLPGTTASARFAVWTAVFCASAAMPLLHLFAPNSNPIAVPSSRLLLDPRWSYLLAGLWVGAALFRLVKLMVEAVSLRKLWREATPLSAEALASADLPPAQLALSDEASSRPERSGVERPPHFASRGYQFRSGRPVQVCITPDVDRPSVIGFFAPKILIPDWLCAQLSPTELRHIVLHEMEHLRRRDDWLNLLQKIGLVLFPLNPAMFWIDRRLSTEREIACDDGVLARTKTPRAYAASLTSVAEHRLILTTRRRMVALALGAFGTGKLFARRSEFAQRIETILGQRSPGRPAIAAVLVAAIIGGSAVIAHTPELVSFRAASSQSASATAAPLGTVAKLSPRRQSSAARFENASLRLPAIQDRTAPSTAQPATAFATAEENAVTAMPERAVMPETPARMTVTKRARQARQAKPQWLLLSAWEQPFAKSAYKTIPVRDTQDDTQDGDVVAPVSRVPVSRVVVRTPDGRFFATPYAAVPTQAGWLIVQL